MNRLRLLLTILFLVVMTFMWTGLQEDSNPRQQSPLDSAETPEYVAVDLIRTVYDDSGNVTQQLTAQKMTFYKKQNVAKFELPQMTLQSANSNGRWQIEAQKGTLFNNTQIELDTDVIANNLNISQPIQRISGQKIYLDIEKNTLVSALPVFITGDNVTMSGSEMTAELNQQQIELQKHAKTIYQTQHK